MLSAFTPKPVVELKQRDKSKIECLLAYGDRLLVGLNNGALRVYRTNESTSEHEFQGEHSSEQQDEAASHNAPRAVELLREEEKFSKKPVQQLAIIKEASILLALSDGYVSFHDLQTYALSERLEKTKGATSFAVISNIVRDPTTGIPSIQSRLAVPVKRKIFIWSWQDMEPEGPPTEMTLVAAVKCLAWINRTKLIAGMDAGYVLIDIASQQITDIEKPVSAGESAGATSVKFGAVNSSGMSYMGMGGWVPKPMAAKLTESEMLLAKDVNTLFIDPDGKPLEKRQVPWAAAPESIGYSYPYLLALHATAKGTLEIRNPDTLALLQSINIPGATILHIPQPNISLAHAGKGFLVASDRCIWRMGAIGYPQQIDELVEQALFDEAISLVSLLEDTLLLDKQERLRDIKMRKAHALFEQQKYRESLELFSEAPAPPEIVISMYPESISGSLSHRGHHRGGSLDGSEHGGSASRNGSLRGKPKASKHQDSDVASIKSNVSSKSKSKRNSKGVHRLDGRDLKFAVNELNAFLAQTRVQLRKFINYDGTLKEDASASKEASGEQGTKSAFEHFIVQSSEEEDIDWAKKLYDVAVLVDTTLFRAYMLTNPGLARSLFRLDNFCEPDVVKDKLYESGRYNDLIDFLHGKKKHEEALSLLEQFGKGKADDDISENLRGPQKTVAYLQQLPFELTDIILQYAKWPMEVDSKLAMEVFLADTENAEELPRDRVLKFLIDIDSDCALQYLEHIIEDWNDDTGEFHEKLIHLYLDRMKKGPQQVQAGSEAEPTSLQERLERLLTRSRQYNKNRILKEFPTEDPQFFESRAIVLSKLSQHKAALNIYVFQMHDYAKAEDYCNDIYSTNASKDPLVNVDPDDPSQSQSIYTALLSLYLTPPSPHEANLDAALDLLSHHGSRLPALSTLNILPTSLPIKDLESYFRGRMRAANSLAREHAVVAALQKVEKNRWDAALALGTESSSTASPAAGRNRRIILGEDRLCPVCHKRFGRAVIKAWPDGEVTHYGCAEKGGGGREMARRAGPALRT